MKFASPGWLWMLLLLPLAYLVIAAEEKARVERFKGFIRESLWPRIVPEYAPGARQRKGALWVGSLAFLLLALARPQWGYVEEKVRVSGMDIVVVLDISNSMETEDVVPSRLKKAKHLIKTLLDGLSGDRVALVPFAGSAYVAVPLTTDMAYVHEQLQVLTPRFIQNQGTDIGLGLEVGRRCLERAAEEDSDGRAEGGASPSHAVILITDGEDQEERAEQEAAKLKDSGVAFFALGVGTEKGAPVPLRDDLGQLLGYKKDAGGSPVISTFKPDMLLQLTQKGNGKYWNITPGEGEATELLGALGALNRTDFAERTYLIAKDRYQWPLLFAILLLLVELSLPVRKKIASTAAALTLGLTAVLTALPAAAHAAPKVEAYLENRDGIKAYRDGKFEEAKSHFGQAQAVDPLRPEPLFNQGSVQIRQGDHEGAIQSLRGAAAKSLNAGDARMASKSFFNLGVAHAQKKNLTEASRAYAASVDLARRSGDKRAEADARKNLELLIQKKKQENQQKQQQQQQGGQSQDQQQKQDPKEGGADSKDPKDSKDAKDSGKDKESSKDSGGDSKGASGYQDRAAQRQRRNFKSEKLSKEDAERVLEELKSREQELQRKRNRQQGRPSNERGKDW